MEALFFWIFAVGTLVFALSVILNRNPVASALSLVLSMLALAGLFVMLNAFFLGMIQILVYAGAVMVLFLFIIMLLDLRAEARRPRGVFAYIWGAALAAFTGFFFFLVIGRMPFPFDAAAVEADTQGLRGAGGRGEIAEIAHRLFTDYVLAFEVVGVLLLVGTLGVVLLSKRADSADPEARPNSFPR